VPKETELGNVSVSKSGRCATWLVGALRIGSAAFTGTTLVIIGQAWGEALGGGPVEAASWAGARRFMPSLPGAGKRLRQR